MRGLQWWLNIKTLSEMRCQKAVNFVHFVSPLHAIYFSLCGIKAGNPEGPCPLREPIKPHNLLSLAQGHYQPYRAKVSLWLTTASLHGGWMPETSRSLYYWQPAPRWRLLPWLATQLRAPMQERENCLDDEVPLQTTPQVHTQSTQKIALNEEQMKFRRMHICKNRWLLGNADALCC